MKSKARPTDTKTSSRRFYNFSKLVDKLNYGNVKTSQEGITGTGRYDVFTMSSQFLLRLEFLYWVRLGLLEDYSEMGLVFYWTSNYLKHLRYFLLSTLRNSSHNIFFTISCTLCSEPSREIGSSFFSVENRN